MRFWTKRFRAVRVGNSGGRIYIGAVSHGATGRVLLAEDEHMATLFGAHELRPSQARRLIRELEDALVAIGAHQMIDERDANGVPVCFDPQNRLLNRALAKRRKAQQ